MRRHQMPAYPGTPAFDSHFESREIELGRTQIRPDREIVVFPVSVRERTMAIGTPRCLPHHQTRLHPVVVLRKCRSRVRKSRNNKDQNDATRAECEFLIPKSI